MSIYYFPWIMLLVASLVVSLASFFWALHRGQFSDQQRARYLPLRGELGPSTAEHGVRPVREVCALLAILAMGVSILIALLVVVIMKGTGVTP
jgi:cbb3-type cytochrome oxidase maturation protein